MGVDRLLDAGGAIQQRDRVTDQQFDMRDDWVSLAYEGMYVELDDSGVRVPVVPR